MIHRLHRPHHVQRRPAAQLLGRFLGHQVGDGLQHKLRQMPLRLADKGASGRRVGQAGQDAEQAVYLALASVSSLSASVLSSCRES